MPDTTAKSFRAGWLLVAILLVGLVLRLVYLAQYSSLDTWYQLTVDNWYHHNWARALAFGDDVQHTTYFRAPLYTWCLAGLYSVFGDSLWVGRLFGLLVGLVSISLTFLIGRRVGGTTVGLIAASLHALYPAMVYFESELLLDPLFTLLLQIALLAYMVALETPRSWRFWLCGMTLGLAAITRPTALVVIPIMVGIMLSRPVRVRLAGVRTTWAVALLLVGTAIVVAPLLVRNLVVADDPVLISSQGGINLYIGNNASADGISAALPEPYGYNWQIEQITYVAEQAEGSTLTPGEVSYYWGHMAWAWIVRNPGHAAGLFFRKLAYQFSNEEISNNRQLSSVWAQFALLRYNPLRFSVLFALAVLGTVWGWRQNTAMQTLLLTVAAYALIVSCFFFNSRFRLPLLPCYFVVAAVGLRGLIALACRAPRRLWGPLAVGAVATLLSLLPPAGRRSDFVPQNEVTQGLLSYAQGDYHEALNRFRQVARQAPAFPEVNLNLGACYFRLGRSDSARACFEREITLHPQRHKAWQNLASLDLVSGNVTDALRNAREAVLRGPYDATAQQLLIRATATDSVTSPAQLNLVCVQAAHATGDDLDVLYEAGSVLSVRRAVTEARLYLERAENAKPHPVETDDRAFGPGYDYDGSAFRKKRAAATSLLAYVYGLDGKWQDAASACRKALEQDSTLVRAWVNLSAALKAEGRLFEADSVANEAVRRFPHDPLVQTLRP